MAADSGAEQQIHFGKTERKGKNKDKKREQKQERRQKQPQVLRLPCASLRMAAFRVIDLKNNTEREKAAARVSSSLFA
jgi:hypothetical protein